MKKSESNRLVIDLFCKFQICSNCHKLNSAFTCTQCKKFRYPTFYCNPKCQKDNWFLHKPKCLEQKRATEYNDRCLFFSKINIDLLYLIVDEFTSKDLGNLAASCSKMRDLLQLIFTLKPKLKRIQVLPYWYGSADENILDFKSLYPSILRSSFDIEV